MHLWNVLLKDVTEDWRDSAEGLEFYKIEHQQLTGENNNYRRLLKSAEQQIKSYHILLARLIPMWNHFLTEADGA